MHHENIDSSTAALEVHNFLLQGKQLEHLYQQISFYSIYGNHFARFCQQAQIRMTYCHQ